jgi:hypothetical protein
MMQLRQVAWVLWIAGTVLIVGSWTRTIPITVGWIGFAMAGVGSLISYAPTRLDKSRYPLTQEGFPVEHSGTPVPHDMTLEPGIPLLAYSQGQWWRVTVMWVEENGEVMVTFPGWEAKRGRFARKLLQLDPDPNRMPITLSPDLLARWRDESKSDGVKTSGSKKGIQGPQAGDGPGA